MRFEEVLHQLYQTTRIISKGLNQRLEPLGIFASEWSIILLLKEKGIMTQGDLACHLNIEPPAITKTLIRLEKKGLIERKPGSDKREKNVFLTQKALKQYPEWAQVVTDHRNMVFSELSEFEQVELARLLNRIFHCAQEFEKSN